MRCIDFLVSQNLKNKIAANTIWGLFGCIMLLNILSYHVILKRVVGEGFEMPVPPLPETKKPGETYAKPTQTMQHCMSRTGAEQNPEPFKVAKWPYYREYSWVFNSPEVLLAVLLCFRRTSAGLVSVVLWVHSHSLSAYHNKGKNEETNAYEYECAN